MATKKFTGILSSGKSYLYKIRLKKYPLPAWGNSLDGYYEMFSSYHHNPTRNTNLPLLPKTNVMVTILKKYQINGRYKLRFLFLHYKDSKIRLIVYATCLK